MDGNTSKPAKKSKKIIALLLALISLAVMNTGLLKLKTDKAPMDALPTEKAAVPYHDDEIESELTAGHAPGKVVMEVTTCRVLGGINIHKRMEMASTTKVMTAFIVAERCRLTDVVTIPKAATGIEGSSIYLREGEKLTVKDLLYGLMLRSGNDAAVALAIHTAGSIDAFAELMNRKAGELGLKNTHFTNPHGLHNDDHYTSAYDLAYISCMAMRNKSFAEIVGTKLAKLQGDGNRVLLNKNKFLFNFQGATGIKTGFTKAAGRCLVAGSKRNGMELVSVVLNCGPMYEECGRLMEESYATYEMKKIFSAGEQLAETAVVNGKADKVPLYLKNDIFIPLRKDGSESYTVNIKANNLTAPVMKDTKCAEVEISFAEGLHLKENLYTINSVEKLGFIDKIKRFFKR